MKSLGVTHLKRDAPGKGGEGEPQPPIPGDTLSELRKS